MNIQDCYELEVIVIGNILNDRKHLTEVAVMPEYFFDQSCRAILEYVTENKTYNLYDMAYKLDVNFEAITELATNIANKAVFQDRVMKLREYAQVRTRVWDELVAAQHAMNAGVDPISAGSILTTNLKTILG